ncbi:MAG: hypothetical protein EAZ58_11390 [Flavobacterium sp.]|jgi:predicted component of type VI protein secretion system|nr:MAG: hypothetical protein EAZ58_11390 [Flavobacterium sp.]
MNKNLNRIVFLLFLTLVLVSCKSSKPVLREEKAKTITIKETVHDTVFKFRKTAVLSEHY